MGLGTVVGVVDKCVIIKHGGKLMRLHASKVLLKEKADEAIREGSNLNLADNEETAKRKLKW